MPTFQPELLYKAIAYCYRAECPLSQRCLRHLSYLVAPDFSEAPFINPRHPQGQACPHYLDATPIRYARGFQRGLNLLRRGEIRTFQAEAYGELACGRSNYYRYARGALRLNEAQQAVLRELFAAFGVEGVEVFDGYEAGYLLD